MAVRRIQCMGYGPHPCPVWWYEENTAGPYTKRCPRCHERRRWLVAERTKRCEFCGRFLFHPKRGGRPRVTCGPTCARKLDAERKRLLRRFA